MAIQGSGYPLPKSEDVVVQPGGIPRSAQNFSVADDWAKIAAAGAKLTDTASDYLKLQTHQAQVGYMADQDTSIARERIELRDKFANDPEGFDAAWKGVSDGRLGQAEPWAVPHIKKILGTEGNSAYSAILTEKRAKDQALDAERIGSLVELRASDVSGAASAGTLYTPEGEAKVAAYKASLDAAVTARLKPQEWADRQFTEHQNRANALVAVSSVGGVYDAAIERGDDPLTTARDAADRMIRKNEGLTLNEQQREHYYHAALSEVSAREAIRKQDVAEMRNAAQELNMASATGLPVNPDEVERIAAGFRTLGAHGDAARLYAGFARKPLNDEFGKQALPDQTQQLNELKTGGNGKTTGIVGPPGVVVAATDQPVRTPNARGYGDTLTGQITINGNTYKFVNGGGGRGSIPFGEYKIGQYRTAEQRAGQGLNNLGDTFDLSDVKDPMAGDTRSELRIHRAARGGTAGCIGIIGDEETFQRFVKDMKTAGPQTLALAPPGTIPAGATKVAANDTGPATDAAPERPANPAQSAWLIANRQKTLDTETRSAWTTVMKDYDSQQVRPNASVVGQLMEAARATNNTDLLETMGRDLDRIGVVDQAVRAPLPEQAANLTELDRRGGEGELSLGQRAILSDLEKKNKAITTGLEDNPISTAVTNFSDKLHTPAPLDFSNDKALIAGLQQRGSIAQFAANNWKVPPRSALDKADLAQMQGALDTADPRQKARIFGAIATLPEDVRNATLAKLGAKDSNAMVEAYAGGLYAQDPAIAESILRGRQAMKADKRFDPTKNEKNAVVFNDVYDKALPATTFGLASRTNERGAAATMRSAVTARYADLAAQAGDTEGKFNEDRLTRSIQDVTGGVLKHNGGTLIAPQRGMGQADFDKALWGIKDSDLADVTTLNGQPVTVDYLRNNARLESSGDGRYRILLGKDPEKPIYAFQNAANESVTGPKVFELDMRGRQAGEAPPSPSRLFGSGYLPAG